jgi:hypothetical protein
VNKFSILLEHNAAAIANVPTPDNARFLADISVAKSSSTEDDCI